ncbi:MAG: hypothetical protein QM808_07125 [Steroidobacteraceae bacterium]
MNNRRSKRISAENEMYARPVADRIEAERRRIFSAMGIIDCCRFLHEYLSVQNDEWPDIVSVLAAAHELLDQVADKLGSLVDEEQVRRSE